MDMQLSLVAGVSSVGIVELANEEQAKISTKMASGGIGAFALTGKSGSCA
jgi:hypothetical protein